MGGGGGGHDLWEEGEVYTPCGRTLKGIRTVGGGGGGLQVAGEDDKV